MCLQSVAGGRPGAWGRAITIPQFDGPAKQKHGTEQTIVDQGRYTAKVSFAMCLYESYNSKRASILGGLLPDLLLVYSPYVRRELPYINVKQLATAPLK
jgi:hypothetical protein